MNRLKPFDPKNLHNLNVRLPSDPGPNPYDSHTPFKGPEWLTSWGWWLQIIGLGASMAIFRYFSNGGSLF